MFWKEIGGILIFLLVFDFREYLVSFRRIHINCDKESLLLP